MATQIPIPGKHQYTIPEWLTRVPENIFPPGPKGLYTYLLVFGRTGCWQYNYRLAERFHVGERTIQRWINWLSAHKLIHVNQPYNRRRRLYAYCYGEVIEWFAGQCFAKQTRAVKKAGLTAREFDARRQLMLQQLLPGNTSPILPLGDPIPPTDSA